MSTARQLVCISSNHVHQPLSSAANLTMYPIRYSGYHWDSTRMHRLSSGRSRLCTPTNTHSYRSIQATHTRLHSRAHRSDRGRKFAIHSTHTSRPHWVLRQSWTYSCYESGNGKRFVDPTSESATPSAHLFRRSTRISCWFRPPYHARHSIRLFC